MLHTSVGCTVSVKASANECVSERGMALSPWRGARPSWLCADCSRKGAAWCGFCCCGVGRDGQAQGSREGSLRRDLFSPGISDSSCAADCCHTHMRAGTASMVGQGALLRTL